MEIAGVGPQGDFAKRIHWYCMDPDRFKTFCDATLIEEYKERAEITAAKGRDGGIDALLPNGAKELDGRCVIQYKFVDTRLSPEQQRSRLDAALSRGGKGFRSELRKPGPMSSRHYIILTSAELNPQFCERWKARAHQEGAPYVLHFWDRAWLDRMTDNHQQLRVQFGIGALGIGGSTPETREEDWWRDFPLEAPPALGALLAREQEKAELVNVAKQQGGVCLIEGPPGIGKTHLLSNVARLFERDERVFWYTMRRGVASLERLAQHLLAFANQREGKPITALSPRLDPLDRARKAFALVAERPTLICLDDSQYAAEDAGLTAFLIEALNNPGHASLLAACRHDAGVATKLDSKAKRVVLSGLASEPAQTLLRDWGVGESSEILVELHRWTQGNPKLLQLSAAWVVLSGRKPAALRELMSKAPGRASIDEYILTEIYAVLSGAEQSVLRAASLMRTGVPAEAISYVAALADSSDAIDRLKQRFLLDTAGQHIYPGPHHREVLQAHPMVSDFCRARMKADQEHIGHARAALYFTFRANGVEDRFEAAHHFSKLGLWTMAVQVLHDCVERLLSRGQGTDVTDFLKSVPKKACSEPDRLWLLWALGTCADFQGRLKDAKAVFQDLRRAAGHDKGLASYAQSAEIGLGLLASQQGDDASALRHHETALKIATQEQDLRGMGKCYHNIATVHMGKGRIKDAIGLFEKDLDICVRRGDDVGAATTLSNMAFAHAKLHQPDKAKDCATKSLEIRQAHGDNVGVGFADLRFAELACDEKEWESALHLTDQAESLAKTTGSVRLRLACLESRAAIECGRGDRAREIEVREQMLCHAREMGLRDVAANNALLLSVLYREELKPEVARQRILKFLADEDLKLTGAQRVPLMMLCTDPASPADWPSEWSESLRDAPDRDHPLYHAVQATRFLRAATEDRSRDAEACLLGIFEVVPDRVFWATILPALLDTALEFVEAIPDGAGLRKALEEISRTLSVDQGFRAFSLILLGTMLFKSGEETAAIDAYAQAVKRTESSADHRLMRAVAEVRLGWLWHRRHQCEIALGHIEAGIEEFRKIGDKQRLGEALERKGDALITARSPATAIVVLTEAEDLLDGGKFAYDLAGIKLSIAMAGGMLNDLRTCSSKLAEAQALIASKNWPPLRGIAAFIEGNLATIAGEYSRAVDLYSRAIQDLSKTSEKTLLVAARASLAQLRMQGF